MLSLGEAGEGSPNASAMLRIATLSAWAQLASSTAEQPYLTDVIKPYRADLATLWIAALRDYASIRAGSEELQDSSSASLDARRQELSRFRPRGAPPPPRGVGSRGRQSELEASAQPGRRDGRPLVLVIRRERHRSCRSPAGRVADPGQK